MLQVQHVEQREKMSPKECIVEPTSLDVAQRRVIDVALFSVFHWLKWDAFYIIPFALALLYGTTNIRNAQA